MIDQPQGDKPALTVVIQSWWTPALAVIMLVVGLLAGYFGRPLVNRDAQTTTGNVAEVTNPQVTLSNEQAAAPTTTVDPTVAAIKPTLEAIKSPAQLNAYLVSQTTHWQGDPNAPVTLIEFSDYQ